MSACVPSSHKESKLHVVIITTPLSGHTLPTIHLAQQLDARGVIVSIISSEWHIAQLQAERFKRSGMHDTGIRLVGLGDKLPEGSDGVEAWFTLDETRIDLLGDVIEKMSSGDSELPAPSCIIADMFAGWSHDVADRFNIPKHSFFTSPAACLSFLLQVSTLVSEGLVPPAPSNQNDLISIPGMPPMHPLDLLPPDLQLEKSHDKFTFHVYHAKRMMEASSILINTFEEMETAVLDALRKEVICTEKVKVRKVMPVGPLLLVEQSVKHAIQNGAMKTKLWYEEWLDTHPRSSVLYISYGSMASISAEQIRELALGLEASEQAFLWVLRPPGAPPTHASQAKQQVSEFLPAGFEKRTQGRGLVVPGWVAQLRILSHPSTGAFLTHCGWNSILEDVCAGHPMLAWPIQGEQRMNCRFVVDELKIAVEFHKSEDGVVEKEEVARVVRLAMTGEASMAMRERAVKLKHSAHTALAEDGSSTKNLEAFVDELKSGIRLSRSV